MNWQVFIIISIIFNSFSTLAQRELLKGNKGNTVSFSILFQLFTGIIIGLFGYFVEGIKFPSLAPIVLNIILITIFYGFGSIFVFKSLKLVEASTFTVIFAVRAIFTVLASSLFLSEKLNIQQIFGTLLIFFAVIIISWKNEKMAVRRGEIYTLLAAVCFGFAVTNDRYILSNYSFNIYSFLILGFLLPIFPMMLFYPSSIEGMKIFFKKRIFLRMIIFCVLYAVQSIAFYSALKRNDNSSQIASINQIATILTIFLSILILKEHGNILKKFIGGILSFIGLILLV